jgi:TRAP-type uncharacterized transport system fused permease subunit
MPHRGGRDASGRQRARPFHTGSDERHAAGAGQPSEELQQIVAESDTGGRKVGGRRALIFWVAVGWSLFQLWYASPLPFIFGFGILNDTERARCTCGSASSSVLCYPAFKRSLAQVGGLVRLDPAVRRLRAPISSCSTRARHAPGPANLRDIVVATRAWCCLQEATLRAVGLPDDRAPRSSSWSTSLAASTMPDVIAHKGASLDRMLSAPMAHDRGRLRRGARRLVGFIFIYVLFGSLLDRAGAGNYMMQVSMAFLGHLRGGPAKVSVVSSG